MWRAAVSLAVLVSVAGPAWPDGGPTRAYWEKVRAACAGASDGASCEEWARVYRRLAERAGRLPTAGVDRQAVAAAEALGRVADKLEQHARQVADYQQDFGDPARVYLETVVRKLLGDPNGLAVEMAQAQRTLKAHRRAVADFLSETGRRLEESRDSLGRRCGGAFPPLFGPSPGHFERLRRYYAAAVADFRDTLELDPRVDLAFCLGAFDGPEDLDKLLDECTAALRLDPRRVDAYYLRGAARLAKGEAEKALADTTEALRLAPHYRFAHCLRAAAYVALNRHDEALTDCRAALRAYPRLAWVYGVRGTAHLGRGEADLALADFNRLLRRDPNNVKALVLRAQAHRGRGDLDRALADGETALALQPESAAAYHLRAVVHADRQDYPRAFADFAEAIRLSPQNVRVYLDRGYTFTQRGEWDQAVVDYSEAVRLAPREAQVYALRGDAYRNQGAFDLALADLNKAARLDPGQPKVFLARAAVHAAREEYPAALADCNRAARLLPREPHVYLARGEIRRGNGDLDRAVADFSRAIALDPTLARAYLARAQAHGQKGELDPALADCAEALRLAPDDPQAYALRGEAHGAAQKYDEAVADFRQARRLDPQRAETYAGALAAAHWCRAYAAAQRGSLDPALEDLDAAIALDAHQAGMFALRGQVYTAKRDYERAVADFTEALRLDPQNAQVQAALEGTRVLQAAAQAPAAPAPAAPAGPGMTVFNRVPLSRLDAPEAAAAEVPLGPALLEQTYLGKLGGVKDAAASPQGPSRLEEAKAVLVRKAWEMLAAAYGWFEEEFGSKTKAHIRAPEDARRAGLPERPGWFQEGQPGRAN
jgi:tetratricopeptide (TPR) repeat protein